MAAHARLKNEFTEDKKYYNLMTWLIFQYGQGMTLKAGFLITGLTCDYCKHPKISDTRKFAVITLKVEQDGFSLE